MAADEILSELNRLGLELRADGNRLRLRPRGVVPPELREAIIRHKDELRAHIRKAEETSNLTPTATEPSLPESLLTARHPLKKICRWTLESNPAASKLSADERQWIAEQLEMAVLNWLERILQPEDVWAATCPRGHHVSQGIFVKCLLGWCCSKCQQVFPASECRLLILKEQEKR